MRRAAAIWLAAFNCCSAFPGTALHGLRAAGIEVRVAAVSFEHRVVAAAVAAGRHQLVGQITPDFQPDSAATTLR